MRNVIAEIEKEMKSTERAIKNGEESLAALEAKINCYKDTLVILQELRKLAEYEMQKGAEHETTRSD